MTECGHCKKPIAADAAFCSGCGKPVRAGKAKANDDWRNLGIAGAIIVGLFLLASVSDFSGDHEPKDRPITREDCSSSVDASVMAEHFVEQRLRSPSTAKFGPYRDMVVAPTGEGCEFIVSSYVDAQNSFGAMVRTHFTAVVRYVPATDKWRLMSLDM